MCPCVLRSHYWQLFLLWTDLFIPNNHWCCFQICKLHNLTCARRVSRFSATTVSRWTLTCYHAAAAEDCRKQIHTDEHSIQYSTAVIEEQFVCLCIYVSNHGWMNRPGWVGGLPWILKWPLTPTRTAKLTCEVVWNGKFFVQHRPMHGWSSWRSCGFYGYKACDPVGLHFNKPYWLKDSWQWDCL